MLVTLPAVLAAPAGAQTAPTTLAGVPGPASDPGAFSTGGIVFLVVAAIIAGGAGILYLRHRPPR
jgi:hypothetical protein